MIDPFMIGTALGAIGTIGFGGFLVAAKIDVELLTMARDALAKDKAELEVKNTGLAHENASLERLAKDRGTQISELQSKLAAHESAAAARHAQRKAAAQRSGELNHQAALKRRAKAERKLNAEARARKAKA